MPGTEDGFWTDSHHESVDAAVQKAREITLKSFNELGSLSKWRDMGIVGLVYDSQGHLVWRGDEIFDEPKSSDGTTSSI